MVTITHDNQGDAISRDVPQDALALIDAGGNGSERFYTYGDIVRLSGAVARGLLKRGAAMFSPIERWGRSAWSRSAGTRTTPARIAS